MDNTPWQELHIESYRGRVSIHPRQTGTVPASIVQSQLVDQKSQRGVWQGHRAAWCPRQAAGQALLMLWGSKVCGLLGHLPGAACWFASLPDSTLGPLTNWPGPDYGSWDCHSLPRTYGHPIQREICLKKHGLRNTI